MANLPNDTGMPQRTNIPYATAPNPAHTLQENVRPTKNFSISRHNTVCQLTHAALRNSTKGGGALYSANDLRLMAADAGNHNQTTEEELASLVTPHKRT